MGDHVVFVIGNDPDPCGLKFLFQFRLNRIEFVLDILHMNLISKIKSTFFASFLSSFDFYLI